MYRERLFLFALIGAGIILFLPIASLFARYQSDSVSHVWQDPASLWSIDNIEGIAAIGLWKCCGISTDPDRVEIGQSGYLFLGNSFNRILDRTTGKEIVKIDTATDWTDHLVDVSDLLAQRNILFLFIIAANKHSIYPEYLPKGMVPADTLGFDLFVNAARDANLTFLDTRDLLKRLKVSDQAYLKTDTHWTVLGGAKAYEASVETLNNSGAHIEPIQFEVSKRYRGPGDLAKILKVDEFLRSDSELDYSLTFDEKVTCSGRIQYSGDLNSSCNLPNIKNGDTPGFDVTVSPSSPNLETVLMICDSFCGANFSLFSNTFRTVYPAHWQELLEQNFSVQIDRLQPDIVIFQLVERNLFDPKFNLR